MKDLWKDRDWKVMLLKQVDKPFDSDDYLYEIKFDGIRCVCFANKDGVSLISRNKKDITYLFPELDKIKSLVNCNVIFDGEIVLLENGKPSFSKLSKRLHLKNKNTILKESIENKVGYVVFDILYENKNLIDKTLIERKSILDKYKDNEVFVKSVIFYQGIKLFNEVKKLGLEGIVLKKKSGSYHINERTDDFIKIKNVLDNVFYVCGYIDKVNSYVFSLLLCEMRGKELVYVGKVNVSKKDKVYNMVLKEKKVKCFFESEIKDASYVKPKIKCEVSYLEKTKSGGLRHAVFKGVIM